MVSSSVAASRTAAAPRRSIRVIEATGVDIEAIRRFVDRSNYQVVPVDDEIIRSQQAVADRFAKLGLIPKPVKVSDIVWKWTPGS